MTIALIALFFLCLVSITLATVALVVVCVVKSPEGNHLLSQDLEEPEEDFDTIPMFEEINPNKRIKKNEPFTPFPVETVQVTDEPFFDEEDPNNTSHDLG